MMVLDPAFTTLSTAILTRFLQWKPDDLFRIHDESVSPDASSAPLIGLVGGTILSSSPELTNEIAILRNWPYVSDSLGETAFPNRPSIGTSGKSWDLKENATAIATAIGLGEAFTPRNQFRNWMSFPVIWRFGVGIATDDPIVSFLVKENYSQAIERELSALFTAAQDEIFENGMESNLSRGLTTLLQKYGTTAISAIARPILTDQINPETASETLRWLGNIDDQASQHIRLLLLERALSSSSSWMRDAAMLGLASMDDPQAVTDLKHAIANEKMAGLRDRMEQVLAQLEKTRLWRSS
jgi:hypothetical protein